MNQGAPVYDNASMRSSTDAGGFWGVLARKAKAILEDDNLSNHSDNRMINPNVSSSIDGQVCGGFSIIFILQLLFYVC